MGRKRKSVGMDNLVDFVKDFNHDYFEQVDAQEHDRHIWRSEVLALDAVCESCIAAKDVSTDIMDKMLYGLELQKIMNMGSMSNALPMIANSMDALT